MKFEFNAKCNKKDISPDVNNKSNQVFIIGLLIDILVLLRIEIQQNESYLFQYRWFISTILQ